MNIGKLNVEPRIKTSKGAVRKLRAQGLTPGICYGHNLDKPIAISLSSKNLKLALDPKQKGNTIIDITISDGTTITAMIKDIQIDPIQQEPLHVDFISIDLETMVDVDVPILIVGKSEGVVLGGQLNQVRYDVTVSCKPRAIPTVFELDISSLNLGDVLHVRDLDIPKNVTSSIPDHLPIITCNAPRAESDTPDEDTDTPTDGASDTPEETPESK